MSTIMIPFLPEFHERILAHSKTMTCRSTRMGHVGDRFMVGSHQYELTYVFRVVLAYVVSDAYVQEGCESSGELIRIWEKIHPKAGYEPDRIVWAHCWKAVKP